MRNAVFKPSVKTEDSKTQFCRVIVQKKTHRFCKDFSERNMQTESEKPIIRKGKFEVIE